jgi:hypothetical protein
MRGFFYGRMIVLVVLASYFSGQSIDSQGMQMQELRRGVE